MNRRSAVTINTGIFLLIFYIFFGDIILRLTNTYFVLAMAVFSVISSMYYLYGKPKLRIQKTGKHLICWGIILTYVLIYNRWILEGEQIRIIRWVWGFLMMILIANNDRLDLDKVLRCCFACAAVHCFFTFFFLAFPSRYTIMHSLWGKWPGGTSFGRLGYKAGITGNYARNATYLVFGIAYIYCKLITSRGRTGKKRLGRIIILILFVIAEVLTLKRAHTLFVVPAMIITYYLYNPSRRTGKLFRILILISMLAAAFAVIIEYLPGTQKILTRLERIGEDSSSESRTIMWQFAFGQFTESPIYGNGWGSFRTEIVKSNIFNVILANMPDAHNIYIQLLAETGIIGFSAYLVILFELWRRCKQMINRLRGDQNDYIILMATMMFLFFMMYGMTGNYLYDAFFPMAAMLFGMIYRTSFAEQNQSH